MSLQRRNLMSALAILVIAVSLPFAVHDTFQTGRVYLFSREFLTDLPQRFTGPGRFRFIMQPAVAILLGVRGGLADAASGNPPYLFALLLASGRRKELLLHGLAVVRNLIALGIILDLVFQLVLYHSVHPAAALLVGPIFIGVPYTLSRALTNRLATWFRRNKESS